MRDEEITHERTVAESCGVARPRTDPAISTGLRLSAVCLVKIPSIFQLRLS
jgi:hypothetical protein